MLESLTSLDKDEVISLLKLCTDAAYFKFQDQIYRQKHGTPMGSPVSVVLAEMMMQKIEDQIENHSFFTPKLWRRYVDDIICILPKEQVESYLIHINSINSNIQFTVEKEENNTLPFLDL